MVRRELDPYDIDSVVPESQSALERYCRRKGGVVECLTYQPGSDVPEVTQIDAPFENKIYRVSDARQVQELLQTHQTVIVEAPMGAGKSSVLKSLRSLYRPSEVVFFQGHEFQSSSNATEKLKAALAKCSEDVKVLVIDSADYLYQDKRFINASKGPYDARSRERMEVLKEFLRTHPDLKCVMPIHDENWATVRANPELKKVFDAEFKDSPSSAVFRPSYYVASTQVIRFLQNEEGLTLAEAGFIALLYRNPLAQNTLNQRGYLKRSEDVRGNSYADILRSAMIISQIFKRFPTLKARLQKGFAAPEEESQFIVDYVDAVLAIDYRSTFLPIVQQERKKRREELWGAFDTLDGTEPTESDHPDQQI